MGKFRESIPVPVEERHFGLQKAAKNSDGYKEYCLWKWNFCPSVEMTHKRGEDVSVCVRDYEGCREEEDGSDPRLGQKDSLKGQASCGQGGGKSCFIDCIVRLKLRIGFVRLECNPKG